MSKWCIIKDGVVRETTTIDPTDKFPPACGWRQCPDAVEQHMAYDADNDNYTEVVTELTEEEAAAEQAAAIAAAEKVEAYEKLLGIVPDADNRREGASYADD